MLGIREQRRVVKELPGARGPFKRKGATDCLMHQGTAVRPRVLRQLELVQPQPDDNLPATDQGDVETHRGAGDEGGVVGAHGGTC